VGGTHGACSQAEPLRIEPEVGQGSEYVPKDSTPRSGKQPSDVFQEDESRSHLANDLSDSGKEVAFVFFCSLLAGDTEGLAGEPGSDEIHLAAPRVRVEGEQVVPDRSCTQGLVFHPRHESGRGVGVPLDVTHSAVLLSEGEFDSELEAADAGT